jgi:hypothetical protein
MNPEKKINLKELEKLCMMQCTDEEIAAFFDLSRERFVKHHKKKPEIIEVMERGKAKGRASLRRAQFSKAMSGHPALLIWMGKQILGQKETVVNEHAGEMTINDGARERLLSKLASLASTASDSESDQCVN